LIFCLERVSRFAIAASSTKKALAISATVRPPSNRRVRAIWALVARAGWQQVNISRSRSSTTDETVSSESLLSVIIAACTCLVSRVDSRRIRSIARFWAVVVSQAPGFGGRPDSGQRCRAMR